MERTGYVPAIQGRGSGTGLVIPSSMLIDEPRDRVHIYQAIIARASNTSIENAQVDGQDKHNHWKEVLTRRLYELHQASQLSSSVSDPRIATNSLDHVDGSAAPISVSPSVCTDNVSFCAFIPRTPRTITELVRMWCSGCPSSNGHPLRLFESATFRKSTIPGYTDAKWRSTRQKPAYQRLKKLMKYLAAHLDPPILNMFDPEVTEETWADATDLYKTEWDLIPLTTVLRRLKN